MTEKIDNAIKGLNEVSTMYRHKWIRDDCELAIRSLKAWEEALQELEMLADIYNNTNDLDYANGLEKAIDIINQKLAEIEERN